MNNAFHFQFFTSFHYLFHLIIPLTNNSIFTVINTLLIIQVFPFLFQKNANFFGFKLAHSFNFDNQILNL